MLMFSNNERTNMNGKTTQTTLCILASALMVAGGVTGCGSKSEPSPPVATPEQLANAKPYPLKTCLVSGEALDSMGGAVSMVVDGQEIKFCCKDCITEFNDNTEKYMAKLAEVPAIPDVPATPKLEGDAVPKVPQP